jgi:hypothetical protein
MEKNITLQCANCNKDFDKSAKEHRRQLKKGNDVFYCGLSCVCKKRNENNPPKGNVNNFKGNIGVPCDEYSSFRWYVLRGEYRGRKKGYGCDLTVEHLKLLWEQQKGICPLTGWKLILPKNTRKAWAEKSTYNASLDRIDNNKGYMQGNVRFISFMANIARQSFTDEQLIEFCNAVSKI